MVGKPVSPRVELLVVDPVGEGSAPVDIRGFGPDGSLVCTLVVDGTGISYYPRNSRDGRPLREFTWQQLAQFMEAPTSSQGG